MMRSPGMLSLAAVFCLSAAAQPSPESPALTHTEGDVAIDSLPARAPTALPWTALVRTGNGRAEIRLRGAVLSLGPETSLRVSAGGVEMIVGSVVAATASTGLAITCDNDVKLSADGVFQFDLRPISWPPYAENECRFRVYKGAASAQLATVAVTLTAGKTMRLNRRCGDMIPTQPFDTAEVDDLHRWNRLRTGTAPPR